MTPKPRPVNTVPIMAAIAEECLTKARKSAHDVAMSSDESALDEYQALVTTSLSCYEAILRDKTLSPREEALTRLRYATVVQEETENWMEAETALTKGVTLCDKVCRVVFSSLAIVHTNRIPASSPGSQILHAVCHAQSTLSTESQGSAQSSRWPHI